MGRLFSTILLVFVSIICMLGYAQNSQSFPTNNGSSDQFTLPCVPSDKFSISGLTYGDPKAKILDKLGAPDKKSSWGAGLPAQTWFFKDIQIDVSGDHILYISTDSPLHSTPSGIRPSLAWSNVLELLGVPKHQQHGLDFREEIQAAHCGEEAYLVLNFDNQGRLIKLGLGMDLP